MLPTLAVVGGFLGAGKTTALLAAARQLQMRGLRVGLITNDQGCDLVDAALVTTSGWPGAAVTGGCFSSRFETLVDATDRLIDRFAPDVLLAEASGSCTNLAATVVRPLQEYYADQLRVAPLSVLVDPFSLTDRLSGGTAFPADVVYLFEQQLAEADLLVVSRGDLLDNTQRQAALATLAQRHPATASQVIASPYGDGIDQWLDMLLDHTHTPHIELAFDTERHATAEAALGWLNASVLLTAPRPFMLDSWIEILLHELGARLTTVHTQIAHLKIQAENRAGSSKASLLQAHADPTFDARCTHQSWSGRALINARALCAPSLLEQALHHSLAAVAAKAGIAARISSLQAFAPTRMLAEQTVLSRSHVAVL